MLAVLALLFGLALAGYGVARWYREREAAVLAEISDHFERRQRRTLARIDEGDRALLEAYRELDRVEQQLEVNGRALADARAELAQLTQDKHRLERMLYGQPQPTPHKLGTPLSRERHDWPLRHARSAS